MRDLELSQKQTECRKVDKGMACWSGFNATFNVIKLYCAYNWSDFVRSVNHHHVLDKSLWRLLVASGATHRHGACRIMMMMMMSYMEALQIVHTVLPVHI